MKFDLKGHTSLKISFFSNIFFFNFNLIRTIYMYMNINIENTQIFHKMKYDLTGQ